MTAPGVADVELVARAIAETRTDCDPNAPCEGCRASARRSLSALAATGRLLPPGADLSEQWSVRKSSVLDGDGVGLPYNTRAPAERHLARFVGGMHPYPVEAELVRRDVRRWPDGAVWVGPWQPAPTNTKGDDE